MLERRVFAVPHAEAFMLYLNICILVRTVLSRLQLLCPTKHLEEIVVPTEAADARSTPYTLCNIPPLNIESADKSLSTRNRIATNE